MKLGIDPIHLVLVASGFGFLLLTSGIVVRRAIAFVSREDLGLSENVRDTGFVIGKCENILIITLMLLNAYTALAVIFAAKAIVRREDMSRNSLYFLAGTMVNVTYSVVVGAVIKILIQRF